MDSMQICKNNSQQCCEIQTKKSFCTEASRGRVSACYIVREGRGQAEQTKRDKPKLVKKSVFMNNEGEKDQFEIQRVQKCFWRLARYFNAMTRNSMRDSQIICRSSVEGNRLKHFPFFEVSLSQRFSPTLLLSRMTSPYARAPIIGP